MCGVLYGVGLVVGSWFEDNVRRVVGGGRDTCFWTDNWVGGVPLRVRFPTFLSWLKTSARRWRIWSGAGGGVMRGDGVGACMPGRRRVSENVLSYYMMAFALFAFMDYIMTFLVPMYVCIRTIVLYSFKKKKEKKKNNCSIVTVKKYLDILISNKKNFKTKTVYR